MGRRTVPQQNTITDKCRWNYIDTNGFRVRFPGITTSSFQSDGKKPHTTEGTALALAKSA